MVNYSIIAVVVFLSVVIILFFLRRNRKDRENLEDRLNTPDVPPEEHREDENVTL